MATVASTKASVGNSIAENAGAQIVRSLTIKYSDIVNAGAFATDDLVSFTIPINAGEAVTAVAANLKTAFDGSGDQLNLTVGDGTDADGYLTAAACHVTQTEITYVSNTGALLNDGTTANTVNHVLYLADDTIDILFDGTAGAAIDLDDLTTGEIVIKVFLIDAN